MLLKVLFKAFFLKGGGGVKGLFRSPILPISFYRGFKPTFGSLQFHEVKPKFRPSFH